MTEHIFSRQIKTVSNPHFWLLMVLFAIGIILHYPQQLLNVDTPSLFSSLGLTRHAVERIFLLLPITYASFFLGLKVGLISVAITLAIMLPRVFLISESLTDALLESVGVIFIGGLITGWFESHRREKKRNQQMLSMLESAQQELEHMQENLRFYLQQVTRAQEEERKRIARELHDDTAQELIALSRKLDSLASNAKHLSEHDILYLQELREQTDKTLDGVRRFSQDLRPSILDDLGLVPALEWLTSDLTSNFGIDIGIGVLGPVRRFSTETELILFRITQEALRNVWKHSEASKAWVTLEFRVGKATLIIKDNGKGFEQPERVGDLANSGKLGLAGMHERTQLVGGNLIIDSETSKGTTITVEIPT
ncbi:sensor histidine kinase [Chloroflexota bacterium]